jgi:hypothetical protein
MKWPNLDKNIANDWMKNHFLSKILMNVGICDYTIMPFVANLAFLQKQKNNHWYYCR